jgi:ribosome maturation factor RimP
MQCRSGPSAHFLFEESRLIRQAPDKVRRPVEAAVRGLGYELVGVEYLPQGRRSLLRVYIDSPEGVTVDDCERVSHQVSGVLDVDDPIHGQYVLEVSSPGLDRPLFTAEHFRRFAGNRVRLRISPPLEGRRNFTGLLKGMQDETVVLVHEDGEWEIPLNYVEQARLVPELEIGRRGAEQSRGKS